MARLTIAQLSAQLEAAHVSYEKLAAENAALKEMLAREIAPRDERPAPAPAPTTTTRVMRGGRAFDKVCVGWNRYVYREVQ